MDSLLFSRIKKDVSPTKLQNLSPQKYGKAAWADLTFTPSKLADNIMYRQAVTLRKNEEGSNKLRELQAMNGFMKERLNQLQHQRDGIEKSLTQQITMYKKMLYQSQSKHEFRLKEIQKRFSTEIALLIEQKEQEAKFGQAQQEMLQNKIKELEQELKSIYQRQANLSGQHDGLASKYQHLSQDYQHLKQTMCKFQKNAVLLQEDWRRQQEQLKKKMLQNERSFQEQLQSLSNEKAREKDSMERLLKTEIQKVQNIRINQSLRKSQQLRDIMFAFENQTKRLNQIISLKERMLQNAAQQSSKNKDNILQMTTSYEHQINSLTHSKNDLSIQAQNYLQQLQSLQSQLRSQINSRNEERQHLGRCIIQLKQQLQQNQIDFMRQRDRFQFWGADIEKENLMLQKEASRMVELLNENQRLANQLRNLRDLLVQSSYEIERSKEELIRLSFQKDNLQLKVEKMNAENQRLYRTRRDIEEDSQKWKHALFTQRSKGYF